MIRGRSGRARGHRELPRKLVSSPIACPPWPRLHPLLARIPTRTVPGLSHCPNTQAHCGSRRDHPLRGRHQQDLSHRFGVSHQADAATNVCEVSGQVHVPDRRTSARPGVDNPWDVGFRAINAVLFRLLKRRAGAGCPQSDSNRHWADFKSAYLRVC